MNQHVHHFHPIQRENLDRNQSLEPQAQTPQTARQLSFAQRRAEARALTPRGADTAEGEDGNRGGEEDGDPIGSPPLSERLPAPTAIGVLSTFTDLGDEPDSGEVRPSQILREQRDVMTALYRI